MKETEAEIIHSNKVKASKIELSGENRIKIEFSDNLEIASMLKQIPDAKWSLEIEAWHIPYSKVAFEQLTKLFPDLEYPNKSKGAEDNPPLVKTANTSVNIQHIQNKNVSIQVIGRIIILKIPKNALDTHFIASFK